MTEIEQRLEKLEHKAEFLRQALISMCDVLRDLIKYLPHEEPESD